MRLLNNRDVLEIINNPYLIHKFDDGVYSKIAAFSFHTDHSPTTIGSPLYVVDPIDEALTERKRYKEAPLQPIDIIRLEQGILYGSQQLQHQVIVDNLIAIQNNHGIPIPKEDLGTFRFGLFPWAFRKHHISQKLVNRFIHLPKPKDETSQKLLQGLFQCMRLSRNQAINQSIYAHSIGITYNSVLELLDRLYETNVSMTIYGDRTELAKYLQETKATKYGNNRYYTLHQEIPENLLLARYVFPSQI